MRDQANCTVLTDQRIQDLQNMVERARPIFGIEAAEPLVDEDRVELDLATRAFDDVR